MTVCKFYMQGNCRYGNNCHYEHPSGGFAYSAQRRLFGGGGGGGRGGGRGGGGGQQSVTFRDSFGSGGNQGSQAQYKWASSDFQKQQGQKQTTVQVSPNDVINSLINEIRDWEQNKMWPFSCIGFEKDCPCIPDFDDKSPEELRSEAYEAIQSGNGQAYENQVQKLATDFYNKRLMLKSPGMQLKQKLISLIEDYRIKKNSRTGNTYGNSGISLFSSPTASPAGTSPFGTSPAAASAGASPFGGGTQQTAFGASSNTSQQNLFGSTNSFGSSQSMTSNLFGNSQFGASGSNQPITTGLFGATQTGTSSSFGTPQTGTSGPFGASQASSTGLFGKPVVGASPANTTSSFGTPQASSFGSNQTGAFGSSTPFSSTPIPGSGSLFGNTSGSFGTGTASTSSPSVNLFGTPPSGENLFTSAGSSENTSVAKSGFGAFGGSSVAPSSGLFGKPAQQTQGLFGKPAQHQQGQSSQSQSSQTSIYTPIDQLTKEELEAFHAPTFTLGKIPTKPPPRELCF